MANQSGTGITFTVTAETAEAAAKLQEFFSGLGENISQMTGLGRYLEELGGRLAAVFTVGALAQFTREAINSAEEMGKLQQKTGLALGTLNALKEQAQSLGVPFAELNISLGLFSDKIYAAVRQGGPALASFRDLGVSLVDASGALRSADDVLADVAQRFKEMPDGPQKASAAMELFGRSGRELIPILNQGREEIEKMQTEGGPFTASMIAQATQFNRSLREIQGSMEVLFVSLAQKILPALQQMANWFREIGQQSGGNLADSLWGVLSIVVMKLGQALVDAFLSATTFFGEALVRVIGIGAHAINAALTEPINQVILWLDKSPKLARLLGGSIPLIDFDQTGANIDAITNKWIDQIKEGAAVLQAPVDDFFDKGIAAAKSMLESSAALRANLGKAVDYALQATNRALGIFGLGAPSQTAPQKSPVSEEAQRLIEQIDRQHAESMQSRSALLDMEEKAILDKIQKEVLDHTKAEEEKTKVTQIYSAKRLQIQQEEQGKSLSAHLSVLQGTRGLIGHDTSLTDAQKNEQTLAILDQENKLIDKQIELKAHEVLTAPNEEARNKASQEMGGLLMQQAGNRQQTSSLSSQGTFSGEFQRVIVDMQNQWGSLAHQMANTFQNVIGTAIDSISKGITGLIMGTKTWGQALSEIGTSILSSVVNAIVKMFVTWIVNMTVMAALQKLLGSQSDTQASTSASSWAPAATLASIASYGGAAAVGTAAVLAALTVTDAFAAGLAGAGAGSGGFAQGGFTGIGGRNEPAGIVHRGEFVFSAPAVARLGLGNLEALHSQAAGSPSVSVSPSTSVNLAVFNNQHEIPAWAKSQAGETHFVDIMKRNIHLVSKG